MSDSNRLELPTITHIGWTVNDIQQTIDFYEQAFGVANSKVFEHKVDGTIRVRGELMDLSSAPPAIMGLMNLWSCPLVLGLGHQEADEEKRIGLDHIGFMVSNVDPWVARLQDMGVEVLAESERIDPIKGRVRTRTMDTRTKSGGLEIEFIEWENIALGNREYYVKIDRNYVRDHKLEIPTLNHIGCVVKDVKQTVDFYEQVLGVGPCEIWDQDVGNVWFKGEQTEMSIRATLMELWSVPLLLMQPITKNHLTEALEKRGEGFYNLSFLVNNLDTWIDRSRDMGVGVLAQIERDDAKKGRVRTATMEPDKMGGFVEFLEWEKMP